MLDIFTAVILGIVEGATEMLPISSTAHLIIANRWWSFDPAFTKTFDIVIQSGAILAVLLYFWNDLWPFGKEGESARSTWKELVLLGVAILPILILGAVFGNAILDHFFNLTTPVAIALIVNGILLFLAERRLNIFPIKRTVIGWSDAILIGIAHAFAIIPGMSRSASASIGGMLLGFDKETTARFSMKMGIPTLLAATIFALYKLLHVPRFSSEGQFTTLVIGFFVSGIVCYVTIKWFFVFLKRYGFRPFAYYRIALGAILLLFI
jgi:undecaprenyl-diphosphatase